MTTKREVSWAQLKKDAKELGASVKRVIKPEKKKPAEGRGGRDMAGAGGMHGRRRDQAKMDYIQEATGSGSNDRDRKRK